MLNGQEIARALKTDIASRRLIVSPRPDPSAFTGSSLDLRLGRYFVSFRQTQVTAVPLAHLPRKAKENDNDGEESDKGKDAKDEDGIDPVVVEKRRTRQYFIPFGKKYILHPGAFVLGSTLEWLRLPPRLSAYVTGKSSLGRHGLVIETAAGIHPNFSGTLTLEIANVGEVPLEIYPGMSICQIFFHRTKTLADEEQSNFAGRRKPHLGTIRHDDVFGRLVKGEDD